MADIGNIINVALIPEGRLAARDNLNVVAIITSELGFLSSNKRYDIYSNAAAVASDFGTFSKAYDYAKSFFATTPNPVNFGGQLVIGYWRAVDEDVPAKAASLSGAELSEAVTVGLLQTVSDGSFDYDVDGATEAVTGLDFRSDITLAEIVGTIDTALTGATATLDNIGIIITSNTTGALSTITHAVEGLSGTFIGSTLGLAEGTGAVLQQGAASETLPFESKEEAITNIKAATNMYGAMFIDQPTSLEAKALAEWAQANSTLVYDVFTSPSNLEIDASNLVWDIKLSSLTNYRMLYSKANNRKMAASYMSRNHTVNFNAENSALTMNLKELSVSAESYTQGEILAAKRVGLDVYTTVKDVPIVLTSGANDFVDNRYNIIGYIDAVQTDTFNLLKQTGTKISQTIRGVNQIVDSLEKTTRGFVRAAVFAPGTWSSPDSFGDLATFNRSIKEKGYYFLAGRLSDQPQSDRQDRKAPVIQGAVKNAGAIHSVDIIINFNL